MDLARGVDRPRFLGKSDEKRQPADVRLRFNKAIRVAIARAGTANEPGPSN